MFTGASPYSDVVDADFIFVLVLCSCVLLGLVVTMVYFVFRYRRKRNPHASNIEGNVPLEVLWTVVPLGLFMYMFYLGWAGYQKINDIPEDAIPLRATARMWQWTFEYPNGVKTDSLYVPVNFPVKLTLHSLDVNHSLYIPAFRVKKDVIPNRENKMWFRTAAVATYNITCAEYCGLRHAYMYTGVVSMDSASFEQWYRLTSQVQHKAYASLLARSPGTVPVLQ
jgi:cytochrome c oxidase subunit 2